MTYGLSFFGKRWVIGLACLIVGFALGALIVASPARSSQEADQRELQSPYQFISPLLACGSDNYGLLPNDSLLKLEREMRGLLDADKAKGNFSDAAVVFRELNDGPGININQNALFAPSSLLKVPLAISIYLIGETKPGFLQQKILFEGGTTPAVEHFTAPTIKQGEMYTVEDLLRSMLLYSDNDAALLLSQLISKEDLEDSYSHLGAEVPTSGQDYSMSVKTYASFFRILYNATYLSHANSEHLLSLLSETTFKDGLIAGLPQGTLVSHKFGERTLPGGSGVQLHDCGIVYRSQQPYLLCVMMKGSDFTTLAHEIAGISKIVYEYEKN